MSGPLFDDNMGGGRWAHNRGVIGAQATQDESARVGIAKEGVYLQLSCTNCSASFVADEIESRVLAGRDPDDMRAEAVLLSWDEIKGMISSSINSLRLHRLQAGGYELIEVCPFCSRHYAQRQLSINPQEFPPGSPLARDAALRRRSVSAIRPLDPTALHRWYAAGKKAGFVL